jgi:hypothetical protein
MIRSQAGTKTITNVAGQPTKKSYLEYSATSPNNEAHAFFAQELCDNFFTDICLLSDLEDGMEAGIGSRATVSSRWPPWPLWPLGGVRPQRGVWPQRGVRRPQRPQRLQEVVCFLSRIDLSCFQSPVCVEWGGGDVTVSFRCPLRDLTISPPSHRTTAPPRHCAHRQPRRPPYIPRTYIGAVGYKP